ncbi:MAG: hypothetical protein ACKO7P_02855 [Bacteroidota bacterium]
MYGMMHFWTLFLFGISLGLFSCNQDKINSTSVASIQESQKKINDTLRIEESSSKSYEVNLGQLIAYSYVDFGSTGQVTNYSTSNDALVLVDKISIAENPSEAEMPGGDETKVTLVYKAKKKGVCIFHVNHFFRSDMERKFSFQIHVK